MNEPHHVPIFPEHNALHEVYCPNSWWQPSYQTKPYSWKVINILWSSVYHFLTVWCILPFPVLLSNGLVTTCQLGQPRAPYYCFAPYRVFNIISEIQVDSVIIKLSTPNKEVCYKLSTEKCWNQYKFYAYKLHNILKHFCFEM